MFDSIADRYDVMNHLLSGNADRRWRRRTARLVMEGRRSPKVLDLCTGTGDLAQALIRENPDSVVVGMDFSLGMLDRARRKKTAVRLVGADTLVLPVRSKSFDAITIAFGVRNLSERSAAFREFTRVLKPGGELVVLEFSPPPKGLLGSMVRAYNRTVMPLVASRISRTPEAYGYLRESMERFVSPDELGEEISAAGFTDVCHQTMLFGAVSIHRAKVSPS